MVAPHRRARWIGVVLALALALTWGVARVLSPDVEPPAEAQREATQPRQEGEPGQPGETGAASASTDPAEMGATAIDLDELPAEPADTEPNDTAAAAGLITMGAWFAGTISAEQHGSSQRDTDMFQLEITTPGPHTIRLHSTRFTSLVVRGAGGEELIARSGSDIAREVLLTDAGTLLIEVSGHDGPYAICVESRGATCWPPGVYRIAGANPHARSAELSSRLPAEPEAAIVVGRNPTELVIAASLAIQSRSPLLALPAGGLSQSVALELMRLQAHHIVIVGDEETVPEVIVRAASSYVSGPDSQRVTLISGADVVDVAADASQRFPVFSPVVYVISDRDAASAMNAAALMARAPGPVLVTRPDEVPAQTMRALARLAPRQIVVVGSERAVSTSVATQIGRYAGGRGAVRVTRVDTDPRETSVALAARYPHGVSEAYLVSLSDPAGALAASAVAARNGAPVLVTGFQLPDEIEAVLVRLRPTAVVIVGSNDMIGPGTEERVAATIAVEPRAGEGAT